LERTGTGIPEEKKISNLNLTKNINLSHDPEPDTGTDRLYGSATLPET
jgi:hypothetical protein